MMPDMDGINLVRRALELDPQLVCILMTGQATVQTAVEAIEAGAFDYVMKPFDFATVLPALARGLELRRLRLDNVQLRETVAIFELSRTLSFTLDFNTLTNGLVDAAMQQAEADEASLLLPDREGDNLYVAVVRGAGREHLLGSRIPIRNSVAGWVALRRESLLLNGEVHDDRFRPGPPAPRDRQRHQRAAGLRRPPGGGAEPEPHPASPVQPGPGQGAEHPGQHGGRRPGGGPPLRGGQAGRGPLSLDL